MRVLVTGSSSLVGSAVLRHLERAGAEAAPYDLVDGLDMLDLDSLRCAARGCDAIVQELGV